MNIILGTEVNIYTNFLIEKKYNKSIHSADQQALNTGFEWSPVISYQEIFMNAFIKWKRSMFEKILKDFRSLINFVTIYLTGKQYLP